MCQEAGRPTSWGLQKVTLTAVAWIKLKGARVSVGKRVESSERNLQEEGRGAMLAMPAQDVHFTWEGSKVLASVGGGEGKAIELIWVLLSRVIFQGQH